MKFHKDPSYPLTTIKEIEKNANYVRLFMQLCLKDTDEQNYICTAYKPSSYELYAACGMFISQWTRLQSYLKMLYQFSIDMDEVNIFDKINDYSTIQRIDIMCDTINKSARSSVLGDGEIAVISDLLDAVKQLAKARNMVSHGQMILYQNTNTLLWYFIPEHPERYNGKRMVHLHKGRIEQFLYLCHLLLWSLQEVMGTFAKRNGHQVSA